MIQLYTSEDFNSASPTTQLPLKCLCCDGTFYVKKQTIKYSFAKSSKRTFEFCSGNCQRKFKSKKEDLYITGNCVTCNVELIKLKSASKRHKNTFCSHSCSTKYHLANKTYGYRRSKLEMWLEKKLITLYPHLEFHFNRNDAINSELDIYIPKFNLAFELNGIFHYEPIFGQEKLSSTQNNDNRKFQACIEAGISLCIIDTSHQKRITDSTCQPFLDIIITLINQHLKN